MPLNRQSVKDQVYIEIKKRIHNNTYQPGARINIDSLTRELNVSNSPVREAISMLARDGLIQNTVNSGPRVVEIDRKDAEDLHQTMHVLVNGAFDICIADGKLDILSREMKKRLALQQAHLSKKNISDYIYATLNFDRTALDIAGNTRLMMIFNSMADIFYLEARFRLERDRSSSIHETEEHELMIEMIDNNNIDELKILLKKHFLRDVY